MANEEQMASDSKSKKGTLTLAIENNHCGRCRTAGYPTCKCGGGGGSGGGDSGKSEKKDDASFTSNQAASIANQVAIQKFDEAKTIFVQSQLFSDKTLNYETGLLSIESDRLRGNLTFRVKPGLSKDETEIAQQFLKAVKTEFDEFKNQLAEQGTATNNFTAILKDSELTICIPNIKYYDEFIKHLEKKNLLPIPNPEKQEEKEIARQEKNRPSPFGDILKGPKPKGME